MTASGSRPGPVFAVGPPRPRPRERRISTIASAASRTTAIHASVRAWGNTVGHSNTDGYR